MGSESRSGPGLGDLEKELTCSICTELLYQPLTLLDCLHTFCGSCLKEWFNAQASRRRSSASSVRFTCPSCRAVVRETRPNATVTTLLDMVLAANPDRAKSAEEKEEIAQRYKHGESIFPKLETPDTGASDSDEDDQRILEQVRLRSLQDTQTGGRAHYRQGQSSRTRRSESVDPTGRREDGRSRRRRDEDRAARRHNARSENQSDNASERSRRIEHQSSLRSLLSLSDAETMEEEILRQIFEEGLLDDIDLDNLGPRQEEELSERIADAYRRRHRIQSRSQQRQEYLERPERPHTSSHSRTRSQSVQRAAPPASPRREQSRNPPVSRPYLLDPLVSRPGASGHQRRLSDQGTSRRGESPVRTNPASSSDVALRPAARSSSDMAADRPRNPHTTRVRTEDSSTRRPRRATASEQNVPNIWGASSSERDLRHTRNRPGMDAANQSPQHASFSARSEQLMTSPTTSSLLPEVGGPVRPDTHSRPSSSRSNVMRSASYTEPSISCDRCGRANIQYELHKKCSQCKNGDYHICLRCYRTGRGCLNWIGFGASAQVDYERMGSPSDSQTTTARESHHVLQSFKYRPPPDTAQRIERDGKEMTSDNPARRLETGLFCDICQSRSNDCFWKCNQCNEGDWGFCNRCVNQGRCCPHALLPICRQTPPPPPAGSSSAGSAPPDNPSQTAAPPPENETFKILSFSTKCDICTQPIAAATLRYHCLQCNDGDYDICANCYLKLVATGKIRKENGHNGWRRCLKGHRMVVVGFEDYEEGQRRVIVRDLVGGRALKDEHLYQHSSSHSTPTQQHSSRPQISSATGPELGTGDWSWKEGSERRKKASRVRNPRQAASSAAEHANSPTSSPHQYTTNGSGSGSEPSTPISPTSAGTSVPSSGAETGPGPRRFPPDGGVGLIVCALWSYYPEDGVQDELMFPRGAEITEAENINDDWFWGCYAGTTGLFPGGHGAVVGEIV